MSEPAASSAAATPIGVTSAGTPVFSSFQPSAASLALQLTPFLRADTAGLEAVLPLPTGLQLVRSPDEKQIQLRVAPFFARKMKRVFAYIAGILLTDGEGADTPAQLQLVSRAPWRYGPHKAETGTSWCLVRINAFVSKSLFRAPAQILKLGACVEGFAEPTSGASKSAQLVGWDVTSLGTWRACSPSTAPAAFDLNMALGLFF